jgi:reactive intermediate/imine deaminase
MRGGAMKRMMGLCIIVVVLFFGDLSYGGGKIITTPNAPEAIGPYSQAIKKGSLVFLSGQIAIDPATGDLVGAGDIQQQTEQVCKNLIAVLEASGMTPIDVLMSFCFLTNIDDFLAFNEIYAHYFGDHPPARGTVEVARLPKGALVEIAVIAGK